MFREYSSQEFCKVTAFQIQPSRSCPCGGRAYVSEELSACMKADRRSPVLTRRSNHAACRKSPRTNNGDGVGANTSSPTVVTKSFSTHLDRTSLSFIRRAQPVSRIVLSLGHVRLLDPGIYGCRSFISRSSRALTLSAG